MSFADNAASRQLTLTIVTDNPPLGLDDLQRFTAAGYGVNLVKDADDLVASDSFPDLVLIDMAQSEALSLAVTRRVRALSRQVGVLVMISHAHRESKTLAFNAGADNCIHKPCDMDELMAMLKSLLRVAIRVPR